MTTLPTSILNPWATDFRARLEESSSLDDPLGDAIERLGFDWLEDYLDKVFSHTDEESGPVIADLIKTPSRKKGTTSKKTRALVAAEKDKADKLVAVNGAEAASTALLSTKDKLNLGAPTPGRARIVKITTAPSSPAAALSPVRFGSSRLNVTHAALSPSSSFNKQRPSPLSPASKGANVHGSPVKKAVLGSPFARKVVQPDSENVFPVDEAKAVKPKKVKTAAPTVKPKGAAKKKKVVEEEPEPTPAVPAPVEKKETVQAVVVETEDETALVPDKVEVAAAAAPTALLAPTPVVVLAPAQVAPERLEKSFPPIAAEPTPPAQKDVEDEVAPTAEEIEEVAPVDDEVAVGSTAAPQQLLVAEQEPEVEIPTADASVALAAHAPVLPPSPPASAPADDIDSSTEACPADRITESIDTSPVSLKAELPTDAALQPASSSLENSQPAPVHPTSPALVARTSITPGTSSWTRPVKVAGVGIRSSWLSKALGGEEKAGLRKSHGAALVAASREAEREHQLAAASSVVAAAATLPSATWSGKRKSDVMSKSTAAGPEEDSFARLSKAPRLDDASSILPPSSTAVPSFASRSTLGGLPLFSPPPTNGPSDNLSSISRLQQEVERMTAKARSRSATSMGVSVAPSLAAALASVAAPASSRPALDRTASLPKTFDDAPTTAAPLPSLFAAPAEVEVAPETPVTEDADVEAAPTRVSRSILPAPVAPALQIAAVIEPEAEVEDDLPSLPEMPSPAGSPASEFPSSSIGVLAQASMDAILFDAPGSSPAPSPVRAAPVKSKKLVKDVPVAEPAPTPAPAAEQEVIEDEIVAFTRSTTPCASPPPAPRPASAIPKPVSSLRYEREPELTMDDLVSSGPAPSKKGKAKAPVAPKNQLVVEPEDEDEEIDMEDVRVDEADLEEIEVLDESTVSQSRPATRLNQSTTSTLAASRLGASTSSQNGGLYAQGSTFAAKALGKKTTAAAPVKSLALAAEAARKEAMAKERKAALSRLAESRRMQALVKKQQEEQAKVEEERRRKETELLDRKMKLAEQERKRKEREEKERKQRDLKEASRAAATQEEEKKRKLVALTPKVAEHKRFDNNGLSTKTVPPASAALPPKPTTSKITKPSGSKVVPSFNHLPPAASSSSAAASSSTIRLVGLGPPVRASDVNKPHQQMHRTSQAQSVLLQQRQQLQSHLLAQQQAASEEYAGQSEAIELPDIKSEYSDSDDEDRPKSYDPPVWAQSPALKTALREQETHNPDDVFGPMKALSMEEVFRARAGKFRARSSSANWNGADRLTVQEEMDYARRMGFKN